MGGNPDKTGSVDASRLIAIIKDEFKMTIDIEVYILSSYSKVISVWSMNLMRISLQRLIMKNLNPFSLNVIKKSVEVC